MAQTEATPPARRELLGIRTPVPEAWRVAATNGGRAAIREVRSRESYEDWYPVFAGSGLAVATWPEAYGGLDLTPRQARLAEELLAPYNLGRLNPLGLNVTAPALFTHGTEEQRQRFLPPLVRNEEKWCQLLSEPGAGSDLASLATRAVLDGDEWLLTGQKVWTTWAHLSDFAICLARTDPKAPKRKGLTYFLVDLHTDGVDVRPLRHIGGASATTCASARSATGGRWQAPASLASARWSPGRAPAASTALAARGSNGSSGAPRSWSAHLKASCASGS